MHTKLLFLAFIEDNMGQVRDQNKEFQQKPRLAEKGLKGGGTHEAWLG